MRACLIPFLFCSVSWVLAQAPGGVAHPLLWSRHEAPADGPLDWREGGTLRPAWPEAAAADAFFNFHPTVALRESPRQVALPQRNWSQLTICSVYRSTAAEDEALIWALQATAAAESGSRNHWLLTTHRAADLRKGDYLNFGSAQRAPIGLHTYFHNFGKAAGYVHPATLYWGRRPDQPDLPVTAFAGLLPELVMYDRVLSAQERARVESYLALKYGLTLAGGAVPADYVDSGGRVLWSAEDNAAFHHQVAGLGRDDASGWMQTRSASAYDPELLRIEVAGAEPTGAPGGTDSPDSPLAPDSYLIWGHNAAPIAPESNERGLPTYSARRWHLIARGNASELPSTLRIDPRQLAGSLGPDDTYWLLIDRSGDDFGTGPIDYVPLAELEEQRFARFRGIHWDTDGNGRDAFALATGPAMLATIQVRPPSCDEVHSGGLTVGAIGGRGPYRYDLRSEETAFAEYWTGDAAPRTLSDLPAGAYRLRVTDADGTSFQTELYLQATDAPPIELERQYTLPAGAPLELAAGPATADYTWTGPAGFRVSGSRVSLSEPGDYFVTAERDGCRAWHRFTVSGPVTDLFQTVLLSPNPVPRRQTATLEVHLAQATTPELALLDAGGRLISRRRLPFGDYFREALALPQAGTYWVRLTAAGQTLTRRLIVQ